LYSIMWPAPPPAHRFCCMPCCSKPNEWYVNDMD
jgi:hypothetical protein